MAEQQLSVERARYARSADAKGWWATWRRHLFFRRSIYGILFVVPAMLFFAVFSLYPMISGLYLSLTDYTLLKAPIFVGFKNYIGLMTNKEFLNGLQVTGMFVLGTTVPKWIISLALALLFIQPFKGREVFKVLYFTPTLLSAVVLSLVWKLLFNANGLATALVGPLVGKPEIFWLSHATLTPLALIMVDNWAGVPFFMIVWIAGLVGIPKDFYEAALIDGAGRWQAFWNITLPLLRPTTLFVVVISTIGALQAFSLQFIMTKGGPSNVTTTIALLVYNYGFNYFRMGVAAAMSVIMFIFIIIVTLIQIRYMRAEETRYT
ncbi:MAG TPA: sugar ABC transporter permease [Caldilineaceae bacterium]|nr:sugar ABC transporter permease [Caldilineaceae bacterium]